MPLDDDSKPRKGQTPAAPAAEPAATVRPVQPGGNPNRPTTTRAKGTGRVMAQANAIKDSPTARTNWVIFAERGHTLADVKTPYYAWRGVMQRDGKIRVGDLLDIFHPGGDYYLHMLIVGIDKDAQGLSLRVLKEYVLSDYELLIPNIDGAYLYEHTSTLWSVRLGEAVLKGGFTSQEEAGKWLGDQKRRLQEQR